MFLLFIMSFSSFLSGRIGVLTSPYSYDGTDASVPIIIDPSNGTIKGNIATDPTDFNQPNVNAIFQNVYISDLTLPANSTGDRLVVQLPNSNDTIKIGYDGRVGRFPVNDNAPWVLGAPEVNGGYSFRINTSRPNLQLYAVDSGGNTALYNTANSSYAWLIDWTGDATFGDITARGNCNINGNLQVNGTITGVVQSQAVAVRVNANYTVPNDGNNYELIVNATSVGAGDLIITVPEDPTHQMEINIVVVDLASANSISVGDGSPELAFIGNGLRSFIDLKSKGISKTTFKYVNYGLGTDWWAVSPF